MSTALLALVSLGSPRRAAVAPAFAGPGPRQAHVLVYDERRRHVVLPSLEELWAWDGTRWEPVAGSGTRVRDLAASAYDSRRDRIVSYGGRVRGTPVPVSSMWEWDGTRWTVMTDSSAGPRDHHVVVYDASRDRTVMFGGSTFPRPAISPNDTWEWDGQRWRRAATDGPSGRITTMVYDTTRRQVLLFGGVGDAPPDGPRPFYRDTWVWNGHQWSKVSDVGPSARSGHALAFDRRAGVVLLYGGFNANREYLDDMWQWDGTRWTEIRLTGAHPGKRTTHAMVYDAHRNRTVLYGGNVGMQIFEDTWEWDGSQWAKVQ